MAKARKSFDKELMYKKIMPTNLKKNNESDASDINGRESDSNNDVVYQEGLVSINANTVYLNKISKPEEELRESDEIDEIDEIDESDEVDEIYELDDIDELIETNSTQYQEEQEKEHEEELPAQGFDNSTIESIPVDEISEEEDENKIIIYNVMESLVMEKLDITLQKMNCCKCDRCKDDIVALALNSLKPIYIVGTKDELNSRKGELNKLGLEVTTAVLKAVLAVRRSPRH